MPTDPNELTRKQLEAYVIQLQQTVKHWQEQYAGAKGYKNFEAYKNARKSIADMHLRRKITT